MSDMKKPKKGGTPKRIGADMNEPGGSQTPGAKARRRARMRAAEQAAKSGAEVNAAIARDENENGTKRSK